MDAADTHASTAGHGGETAAACAGPAFLAKLDGASKQLQALCAEYNDELQRHCMGAEGKERADEGSVEVALSEHGANRPLPSFSLTSVSRLRSPPCRNLPRAVEGLVRAAIGQAQLLLAKRLPQFGSLCQQNMDPDARPPTTNDDLAGFWDLISWVKPRCSRCVLSLARTLQPLMKWMIAPHPA